MTPLTHPPLEPLHDVVARLQAAGIDTALGGSGLLAAFGLETTVHDWDLTTDAAQDEVAAALAPLSPTRVGSSGIHADSKVMLPAVELEVICRFAFVAGDGVIRIPTIVTGAWNGVPLGSPEAWAVAYALLGREPKADRLFRLLATRGADDVTVDRLLREPLPEALQARLRTLPPR